MGEILHRMEGGLRGWEEVRRVGRSRGRGRRLAGRPQ